MYHCQDIHLVLQLALFGPETYLRVGIRFHTKLKLEHSFDLMDAKVCIRPQDDVLPQHGRDWQYCPNTAVESVICVSKLLFSKPLRSTDSRQAGCNLFFRRCLTLLIVLSRACRRASSSPQKLL